MSFSITTLRGFTVKTFVSSGGSATLSTPVVSNLFDCGDCGIEMRFGCTITGPVGSVIKFTVGQYSDSFSVTCDNYTYVTEGNIVYFNSGNGNDDYPCLSRMPNGITIKAIACNGSEYSEVLTVQFVPVSCPSTIPSPTINILSNVYNGDETSTLTYNVTSNYCNNTYITDSSYYPQAPCAQGQAPNPTDSIYQYIILGSGTTSSNYQLSCTAGSQYHIRAVTYFTHVGCTSLQSSESYTYGNLAT